MNLVFTSSDILCWVNLKQIINTLSSVFCFLELAPSFSARVIPDNELLCNSLWSNSKLVEQNEITVNQYD